MRAGYNPNRRNRNLGTKKAGHGQTNRLVIPDCELWKVYYECLGSYRTVARQIGAKSMTFIIEAARADSKHACTVDDVARLLHHVSPCDLDGIELIVMRQPTRKQEVLDPVWGRFVGLAEIGRYEGRAIFLESVSVNQPIRWSKSMRPDRAEELERLRADGHSITTTRHHHLINLSIEAIRSTQLYRALLHEIGHNVDYNRDPERFDQKLHVEKEQFAHAYADSRRKELMVAGVIPFERILDPESLERDGLVVADFIYMPGTPRSGFLQDAD